MGTKKSRKKRKVSLRRRVGSALVSAFQFGIHINHLALKYTIDSVENLEANVMLYADGIDKQDTIKYRQANTVLAQLLVKAKIAEIKKRIVELTTITPEGGDEVVNETAVFQGPDA